MGLEFTIDDELSPWGQRALFFPSNAHDRGHCNTLGYECIVVGQVRSRSPFLKHKRFLILLESSNRTFVAQEKDLIFQDAEEKPPILAQGEVVVAWESRGYDQEIVGTYRASQWVPRIAFIFRHATVFAPHFWLRKSTEGRDMLIYEAPRGEILNLDFVITALGQVTGQRNWRLLPYLS